MKFRPQIFWAGSVLGLAAATAWGNPLGGSSDYRKIIAKVMGRDSAVTTQVYGVIESLKGNASAMRACFRTSKPVTSLADGTLLPDLVSKINQDHRFATFVFLKNQQPAFPHRGYREASLRKDVAGNSSLVLTPLESWSKALTIPYCTAEDLSPFGGANVIAGIYSPGWVCGADGKGVEIDISQRGFDSFAASAFSMHGDIVSGRAEFQDVNVVADSKAQVITADEGTSRLHMELDTVHSFKDAHGQLRYPATATLIWRGQTLADQARYSCLPY